jgi:hypothetical protein
LWREEGSRLYTPGEVAAILSSSFSLSLSLSLSFSLSFFLSFLSFALSFLSSIPSAISEVLLFFWSLSLLDELDFLMDFEFVRAAGTRGMLELEEGTEGLEDEIGTEGGEEPRGTVEGRSRAPSYDLRMGRGGGVRAGTSPPTTPSPSPALPAGVAGTALFEVVMGVSAVPVEALGEDRTGGDPEEEGAIPATVVVVVVDVDAVVPTGVVKPPVVVPIVVVAVTPAVVVVVAGPVPQVTVGAGGAGELGSRGLGGTREEGFGDVHVGDGRTWGELLPGRGGWDFKIGSLSGKWAARISSMYERPELTPNL